VRRVDKPTLYALVEESRACGMGPRHLARLIGYNHQHLSRIALVLGLPPRARSLSPVRWTERLVELIEIAGHTVDKEVLAPCPCCGKINGGIVRPQQT